MERMRKQMASFWRKLSRLIDSGVPLLSALEVAEHETEEESFRGILQEVSHDIVRGKRLSETLERHPERFPPSTLKLVVVGEQTGSLDKVALRIAEGLEEGTFQIGQQAEAVPDRQMMPSHGADHVSVELVANIIMEPEHRPPAPATDLSSIVRGVRHSGEGSRWLDATKAAGRNRRSCPSNSRRIFGCLRATVATHAGLAALSDFLQRVGRRARERTSIPSRLQPRLGAGLAGAEALAGRERSR